MKINYKALFAYMVLTKILFLRSSKLFFLKFMIFVLTSVAILSPGSLAQPPPSCLQGSVPISPPERDSCFELEDSPLTLPVPLILNGTAPLEYMVHEGNVVCLLPCIRNT